MRLLAVFPNEEPASLLADTLYVHDIETSIKPTREGEVALWVHDERDVTSARVVYEEFERDPAAKRFVEGRKRARAQRRQVADAEKKSRHRQVKAREALGTPWIGSATLILIGCCIGIAVISKLGEAGHVVRYFTYADLAKGSAGLVAVQRGEVWRVLTPIFVHFGFLHLFFNMWWLKDLGTAIERAHSAKFLLFMVVVTGVLSNSAQFFMAGPKFGGMSGVILGLFGYIWVRGRRDPTFPLGMPKSTVMWMMVFFVLCWTGVFANVANIAHTAGLAVGAGWGYLAALRRSGG